MNLIFYIPLWLLLMCPSKLIRATVFLSFQWKVHAHVSIREKHSVLLYVILWTRLIMGTDSVVATPPLYMEAYSPIHTFI